MRRWATKSGEKGRLVRAKGTIASGIRAKWNGEDSITTLEEVSL